LPDSEGRTVVGAVENAVELVVENAAGATFSVRDCGVHQRHA